MKNWLKKVLSLLTAIALLVSVAALAFAEESNEPIDITNAEEVSLNNNETSEQAAAEEAARLAAEQAAAEEAARLAAEQAAAEEAARLAAEQAAAEEAARLAAEQAAAEEAARLAAEQAAAEEAARKAEEEAAGKAAEQDAAQKANDEAEGKADEGAEKQDSEPVSSYYNDDETITDDEGTYPVADLFTFEDGDNGSVDDVTVEELGLVVTTEMKFPEATALNLNDTVTGTLDAETIGEYIIHWDSNRVIVLDLETSSDDVEVVINDKAVQFEKTEGSENNSTYGMMIAAEGEYHIVLTSSNPVSYTLTVKDAYAEATKTEATEENEEENNEGKNDENKQEGNNEIPEGTEAGDENLNNNENETEGNGDIDGETNTDEETPEIEYPVIRGWITIDTEAFNVDSTITLKANAEVDLGDMVFWQTKVQNENGEEVWEGLGYGATYTVKLDKDNINGTFRFKMEGENYSDEYTLGTIEEEAEETVDTTEAAEDEANEENEEEANEEEPEVTEEETAEDETTKMTELGYTKVVVTAEEGADLFAEESKESEVLGHLDAKTEVWVLLNEDQTWGRICEEAKAEVVEEAVEAVKETGEEANEENTEKVTEETIEATAVEEVTEATEETAETIATAKYISIEDAEIVKAEAAEEVAEETEETEETEEVTEKTDEEMIEMGYTKIVVTAEEGADLYAAADKESEVVGRLDPEAEAWVLLNEEKTWGQLFDEAEVVEETTNEFTEEVVTEGIKEVAQTVNRKFVSMDMATVISGEAEEEIIPVQEVWYARNDLSVVMVDETGNQDHDYNAYAISTVDNASSIPEGTFVSVRINVDNLTGNEICEYQWYYSKDGGESWTQVEGANSATYGYIFDYEMWLRSWKAVVIIR